MGTYVCWELGFSAGRWRGSGGGQWGRSHNTVKILYLMPRTCTLKNDYNCTCTFCIFHHDFFSKALVGCLKASHHCGISFAQGAPHPRVAGLCPVPPSPVLLCWLLEVAFSEVGNTGSGSQGKRDNQLPGHSCQVPGAAALHTSPGGPTSVRRRPARTAPGAPHPDVHGQDRARGGRGA